MSSANECIQLLRAFLVDDLDIRQFEPAFLRCFKDLPIVDPSVARPLESVFLALDAFDAEAPAEPTSAHVVSYAQLWSVCQRAMTDLKG